MDVHPLSASEISVRSASEISTSEFGAGRRCAAAESGLVDPAGRDIGNDNAEPADSNPVISYVVREAPPLFTGLDDLPPPADTPRDPQPLPLYHDTNVLVVLDLSVLRTATAARREDLLRARLAPAQSVLSNLLHAYGMTGDMRVAVAGFAEGCTLHCSWNPLATALGSLDRLTSAALFKGGSPIEIAASAWQRGGSFTDNVRNIMYFLSEGGPESGGIGAGLTPAEKAAWNRFVADADSPCDRVISVALHHAWHPSPDAVAPAR